MIIDPAELDDEMKSKNESAKESANDDKSNKILLNFNEIMSEDENKIEINAENLEDHEADNEEDNEPIQILIEGIDEDDKEDLPKEQVQEQNEEDEENICTFAIPLDGDEQVVEEQDNTVFKIPTTDLYDKDSPSKRNKARKRESKDNRKIQDSVSTEGKSKRETIAEEVKKEPVVIKNSIRNFYKLDMQKVTMQVNLKDPSQSESLENRTYIKGQTIMMFNRNVDETSNIDTIRDLRLDIHCKNIKITGIHLAKRYKKKDENKKVIETLHEKKEPLNYKYDLDEFKDFKKKAGRSEPDEITARGSYEFTGSFQE
mmetsp:Transcript_15725/g.18178  ORF Transcript_15725/g.18178 Transcript_15725/m.18178 type:complete len:315 (-) Transcript_15725:280-1224(-)